jgi:hypothetical protein
MIMLGGLEAKDKNKIKEKGGKEKSEGCFLCKSINSSSY